MSQFPTTITGHLTHEPHLTKFSSGSTKTWLRIASSRKVRDGAPTTEKKDLEPANSATSSASEASIWRDTDVMYFDIEVWGQLALNCRKSLKKGMPVIALGSLVTDTWGDEGDRRSKTYMRAFQLGLDLNRYVVSSLRVDATHTVDGVAVNSGLEECLPDTDLTGANSDHNVTDKDHNVTGKDDTVSGARAVFKNQGSKGEEFKNEERGNEELAATPF